MIKAWLPIVIVAAASLTNASTISPDWHSPDDIPVTGPVSVLLAGEMPADIVRFLMANGAKAS